MDRDSILTSVSANVRHLNLAEHLRFTTITRASASVHMQHQRVVHTRRSGIPIGASVDAHLHGVQMARS